MPKKPWHPSSCQPEAAVCSLGCLRSWQRLQNPSRTGRQQPGLPGPSCGVGLQSVCAWEHSAPFPALTDTESLPSAAVEQILSSPVLASVALQSQPRCFCRLLCKKAALPSPLNLIWKVQSVCALLRHEVIPVATVPSLFSAFFHFSSTSFGSSISRQRSYPD